MPKFEPPKKRDDRDDKEDKKNALVVPESWVEPRCHVCNSKYRIAIDRMIALGTGFTEISRVFGGEIDRRSIANHSKRHLGYEDAAIRRIVEQEAQAASENAEEGISGAVNRRSYLRTALQKAMEDLVLNNTTVEPRDAVQIIQLLEKLDADSEGIEIESMKIQFNAFVQAIREISQQYDILELGPSIFSRAKQIAGDTVTIRDTPQLES